MKNCNHCGEKKSLDSFPKGLNYASGVSNTCRVCMRIYKTGWARKNKDKMKLSLDKYRSSEKFKSRINKYQKDYHAKNHKKKLAHFSVRHAVKSGKIQKAPCEICGENKVVAHHDDYSNRLKVRWLCQIHHSEWHKKNEAIND